MELSCSGLIVILWKLLCCVRTGLQFERSFLCWVWIAFKWSFQVRTVYNMIFEQTDGHFLISLTLFGLFAISFKISSWLRKNDHISISLMISRLFTKSMKNIRLTWKRIDDSPNSLTLCKELDFPISLQHI